MEEEFTIDGLITVVEAYNDGVDGIDIESVRNYATNLKATALEKQREEIIRLNKKANFWSKRFREVNKTKEITQDLI